MVINCAILLVLVICLQFYTQFSLWKLLSLCVALVFIVLLNVNAEQAKFELTNNYANYRVLKSDESSPLLQINEANRSFQDDYSKQVFNTIHAAFPYCMLVPLGFETSLSNIIYICSKTEEKKVVYREYLNTVTTDYYQSKTGRLS